MFNEFIRTHKVIAVVILIFVISLIGYTTFIFISRSGKEPVEIYLIPRDTKLTVGEQQFGPGTAYIAPGTYEVVATRSGFADFKGTVTIGTPNTSTVDVALRPISDAAIQWKQEHQQLYLDYEGRASRRANSEGLAFREQNPIVNRLPLDEMVYTIGYRTDPDKEGGIILEIDAITGYRNAAIEQIRALGFDPTHFKINFRNYENPFSHE